MFLCGRRSFRSEDRDEDGSYMSPHSRPKRWKKSKRLKGKRNPYADRGLDRFHTLLADLDEEKQKIYRQFGMEDVSFVRFVYSDSFKHVTPIVVRAKNHTVAPTNSATTSPAVDEEIEEKKKENINGSFCFVGVMMVLVLVLLFYGRSFAILCTTLMWYLLPRIFGSEGPHHHHYPR